MHKLSGRFMCSTNACPAPSPRPRPPLAIAARRHGKPVCGHVGLLRSAPVRDLGRLDPDGGFGERSSLGRPRRPDPFDPDSNRSPPTPSPAGPTPYLPPPRLPRGARHGRPTGFPRHARRRLRHRPRRGRGQGRGPAGGKVSGGASEGMSGEGRLIGADNGPRPGTRPSPRPAAPASAGGPWPGRAGCPDGASTGGPRSRRRRGDGTRHRSRRRGPRCR